MGVVDITRMDKIVIMKVFFFTYGIVGGGAERVMTLVVNGLVDRGYEVGIVVNNVPAVYEISSKVKILHYNQGSFKRLKYRLNILRSMRNILKVEKPDFAVGVLPFYSLYLFLASIGLSVKTIAWDHSSYRPCREAGRKFPFTKQFVYPFLDKTFVLTEADKKLAFFKKNISVMPNPTTFLPEQHGNRENVILGVGNVGTWKIKGFDLLLNAWTRIYDKYPDWKLKIVGRGDTSFLNERIASLKICERTIVGAFTSDIKNEYAKCSIFVLSSRTEGFPMCLLEAMSQGCACVATENYGRTSEIAGGDSALLYPSCDTSIMCENMEKLIDNIELRETIGYKAFVQSQNFMLDCILDKWDAELKQL